MVKNWIVFLLIFMLLFSGFSSVSASAPAKIVSGILSNVASALLKWLLSLNSTTKTVVSGRSMVKFEAGYNVETVFDGTKLGIEPYSAEVSADGELLVLDSAHSNIYKISTPISRYNRAKLIVGSPEGYSGHVDGRPREARMNRPKGLTMDDTGNIYIADTLNMAIRKISEEGVTTIAGGKWGKEGHVDGPSEDAKFSNDFDIIYARSSCSLLVIDRGNQAIREIQLHSTNCSYQYDSNLNLAIVLLVGATFFGYMLALLQRRVQAIFSSQDNTRMHSKKDMPINSPYQRPYKSVRPPIIPSEDEREIIEDGFFTSLGRLFLNTSSSLVEIFSGLYSVFGKKQNQNQNQDQTHQQYQKQNKHPNSWPLQESFIIPREDQPPSLETRTPMNQKTYPVMTNDHLHDTHQQFRQTRTIYNSQQQNHRHHQRHYSSNPDTCFEQSCETSEIVFGAVQEHDGRREAVVIKAVDYSDPVYNKHNVRSRLNYMGYSYND